MLTMTDLFCGAGGSSSGAVAVPGVTVRIAANHWRLAVDTHQANHPGTDHDVADLSQVDPRRYPTTDLAWFSPSCTNHSIAKGRRRHIDATPDLFGDVLPDEAAERSRATMWDVIRFAEHHAYRAVVVENVIDAKEWILWPAWSAALSALGYEFRTVSLNSMHAAALGRAAPQSRDRLYVVAWRTGERAPDLDRWTRPVAECAEHGRVRAVQGWRNPRRAAGRYRSQYLWRCPISRCHAVLEPPVRPAAEAIDWTLPAVRIADRARPLAAKTMRRVVDGFETYGTPALLVPAGGTWNATAYPVERPMRTRTTTETEGVTVPPLLIPCEGRTGKTARRVDAPMRTLTARNETALAVPPFIAELRGGGSNHRPVSEPLATVCAEGNHHLLLEGGVVTQVEDLGFRMLAPHEYANAMAFPNNYVLLGNKRERVRMAGNAVTPPAARDLIAAVAEAVTGEQVTPETHQEGVGSG